MKTKEKPKPWEQVEAFPQDAPVASPDAPQATKTQRPWSRGLPTKDGWWEVRDRDLLGESKVDFLLVRGLEIVHRLCEHKNPCPPLIRHSSIYYEHREAIDKERLHGSPSIHNSHGQYGPEQTDSARPLGSL